MQIINFTELSIKPSLQDRSKCFTIRRGWDWLDEGQNKNACWREQTECIHKTGNLRKLVWNQRGKNNVCENCCKHKPPPDLCDDIIKDYKEYSCFSKVFGVVRITQIQKIWMSIEGAESLENCMLNVRDADSNPLEVISELGIFFARTTPTISEADGFKNSADFRTFFLKHYPIIQREEMPFWRIGWEWAEMEAV